MFGEPLNLSALNSRLATRRLGKAADCPNEVWDSIDSTNARALELAKGGAPEGVIVAARQQTSGRGRLGRVWISPPDAGIYISFILRPALAAADAKLITFAAGVAVVQAVEAACGVSVGLKWVNDIVSGGKKLGGILAEMASAPATLGSAGSAALGSTGVHARMASALVIGIGLNLQAPNSGIPNEIAGTATYLEQLTAQPVEPNVLAAAIAVSLEKQYDYLLAGRNSDVIHLWKNFSVTLGKRIKAQTGQDEFEGVAQDVAPDGSLVVLLPSGETTRLHAGEISIRNSDGTYA